MGQLTSDLPGRKMVDNVRASCESVRQDQVRLATDFKIPKSSGPLPLPIGALLPNREVIRN